MADGYLSTEQVLLLENLMYMGADDSPLPKIKDCEGKSIESILSMVDVNSIPDDASCGSYMTGKDWKDLVNAIKNDPELCKMTVAATHVDHSDGGGGGVSAVFTNPDTKEAVVAFRGTAQNEWKDNFVGGATTDTPQQQNALDWYQEVYEELGLDDSYVTVTGHSKGGNKAKYITLLDNSVDRCVSFDGQGFSDEFMEKYEDQIAQNQHKIENNNVDYDYVNLLLNDVGNTTYYKGYDYGEGGVLEAHCPNTFFKYDENGNPIMNVSPTGQSAEMKAMDEFLNSYLRSLSPSEKAEALELIGTLVQGGFGGEMDGELFDILMDPDNQDMAAHLVAYLIEYEQAHPEFKDHINNVMNKFGMGEFCEYVNTVDDILNNEYFDKVFDAVDWVSGHIPNWVIDWVLDKLKEEYGIELTREQAKNLLAMIGKLNGYMDDIKIKDNGGDIVVEDTSFGNVGEIKVFPGVLSQGIAQMESIAQEVENINGSIDAVRASIDFNMFGLDFVVKQLKGRITRLSKDYAKIAAVMSDCLTAYEKEEQEIEALFPITKDLTNEGGDWTDGIK